MPSNRTKRVKEFSPQVGERVAAFYRKKFPRNTAKHMARETDCAVETAKNWLRGHCPANEHFFGMLARHGKEFAAFVLAPVDEDLAAIARYEHEIAEIKEKIRELSEAIDDPRG